MSEDNFWTLDDAAGADVPEPPKPTSNDLPDKAAVLVRTCDSEDKETVQPALKQFERKDGSGSFFRFKCPVQVIGGDAKITERHVGRYLFTDFFVEKPTAAQLEARIATAQANGWDSSVKRHQATLADLDKYPCDPDLYHLILSTLAPSGNAAKDRWAQARGVMAPFGKDPAVFGGNKQLAVVAAFREALLAGRRTLIGVTHTPTKKEGDQYDPQQTVRYFGSDTAEERKRRKVRPIDKVEEGF